MRSRATRPTRKNLRRGRHKSFGFNVLTRNGFSMDKLPGQDLNIWQNHLKKVEFLMLDGQIMVSRLQNYFKPCCTSLQTCRTSPTSAEVNDQPLHKSESWPLRRASSPLHHPLTFVLVGILCACRSIFLENGSKNDEKIRIG